MMKYQSNSKLYSKQAAIEQVKPEPGPELEDLEPMEVNMKVNQGL